MEHKLVLESQALWENGQISWPELTARLAKADVLCCWMDVTRKRAVYEDADGQEFDLPLTIDDRILSGLSSGFKDVMVAQLRSITLHPAQGRIVCEE